MGQHTAPDHLRIGTLQTIPHDGGPTVTEDLVCCVHCGYIWSWSPGSGRVRGWCMKCNGLLCGRKCCRQRPCQHWMHGIENIEAGRPENTPHILVNVPAAPPAG